MSKVQSLYYIPTGLDSDFCELLIKKMAKGKFMDASTFSEPGLRSSKVQWINTDSWVGGMMAHYVNYANLNVFGYKLSSWADKIQYTVYNEGDRYGWHSDLPVGHIEGEFQRKLSIIMSLSSIDDYEGGEVQIKLADTVQNLKLDAGDAVVFPADALHRVRTVRSGKRITLVGWYGGPKFI